MGRIKNRCIPHYTTFPPPYPTCTSSIDHFISVFFLSKSYFRFRHARLKVSPPLVSPSPPLSLSFPVFPWFLLLFSLSVVLYHSIYPYYFSLFLPSRPSSSHPPLSSDSPPPPPPPPPPSTRLGLLILPAFCCQSETERERERQTRIFTSATPDVCSLQPDRQRWILDQTSRR